MALAVVAVKTIETLLDGIAVRMRPAEAPFPERASHITLRLQQLAQALQHLHVQGYAHGDVKLEVPSRGCTCAEKFVTDSYVAVPVAQNLLISAAHLTLAMLLISAVLEPLHFPAMTRLLWLKRP